jgi:hypothetical protein
MISAAKIIRLSLGGMLSTLGLLTLSLGDVASAADQTTPAQSSATDQNKAAQIREAGGKKGQGLPCDISPGQNLAQAEQNADRTSRLVTGELVQTDGKNFVVKEEGGKEVRLQLTDRTRKTPVNPGDQISVSIDDKNQALWIRANRGTDKRTEHASADCNPTEEPSDKLMKKSKGN